MAGVDAPAPSPKASDGSTTVILQKRHIALAAGLFAVLVVVFGVLAALLVQKPGPTTGASADAPAPAAEAAGGVQSRVGASATPQPAERTAGCDVDASAEPTTPASQTDSVRVAGRAGAAAAKLPRHDHRPPRAIRLKRRLVRRTDRRRRRRHPRRQRSRLPPTRKPLRLRLRRLPHATPRFRR